MKSHDDINLKEHAIEIIYNQRHDIENRDVTENSKRDESLILDEFSDIFEAPFANC